MSFRRYCISAKWPSSLAFTQSNGTNSTCLADQDRITGGENNIPISEKQKKSEQRRNHEANERREQDNDDGGDDSGGDATEQHDE